MNNVDINKYSQFVDGVMSETSKDLDLLTARLGELDRPDFKVATVLTASLGLSGEVGEFNEMIKKIVFHGKEMTPELHTHLRKELSDIGWYWIAGCLALGVTGEQIIIENVDKLMARYPGGKFSISCSENRSEADI